MSTQTQETFIQSIKDIETQLTDIGFSHLATTKKGYATYVDFKSADKTQVSFMFGPSDWNVEILLTTNEKKYAFKDLLQIPSIALWTKDNKFQPRTNDRAKDELSWYIDLLTFVIKEKPWTS
jgi:hypothetical protein